MPLVAVTGDCTTTTCVALAAGWPTDDELTILEADPTGGSLAAWLDTPSTPSLATIVANAGGVAAASTARTIDVMTQRSESGIRFVAAPARSAAARRALDEAATSVVPVLARATGVTIADCGRPHPSDSVVPAMVPAIALASVVVVVHRQDTSSAGAAAVRLERLVEGVEQLATSSATVVLAVIGDQPFDPAEIAVFVDEALPGIVGLRATFADDPLSAAVLAGRVGVSGKRLRRLPLLRSAAQAALVTREALSARDLAGAPR